MNQKLTTQRGGLNHSSFSEVCSSTFHLHPQITTNASQHRTGELTAAGSQHGNTGIPRRQSFIYNLSSAQSNSLGKKSIITSSQEQSCPDDYRQYLSNVYINKQGGAQYTQCFRERMALWEWCILHNRSLHSNRVKIWQSS